MLELVGKDDESWARLGQLFSQFLDANVLELFFLLDDQFLLVDFGCMTETSTTETSTSSSE